MFNLMFLFLQSILLLQSKIILIFESLKVKRSKNNNKKIYFLIFFMINSYVAHITIIIPNPLGLSQIREINNEIYKKSHHKIYNLIENLILSLLYCNF